MNRTTCRPVCGNGVCVSLLGFLLLAGCNGGVPTFEELTKQTTGTPAGNDQSTVASPPANQAVAQPSEPVKQDPALAIAAFQKIPPGAHDDNTLGGLLNLTEGLELVEEINAMNSKVTDHGVDLIYKLPSLRRLELVGTTVSDKGCESIGKVSSLEELSLTGGGISDVGMTRLANLTQLKRLIVNGTQIGLAGWEIIGQLPALEELWIQQSSLNDAAMEAMCNATTLRRMYMNDTAITDRGLNAFRKLELLEELNLSGCNVTCEGFLGVVKGKGLKNLTKMIVQRTPLNDKGVAAISGMTQLEELNIAELSGMSDAHFMKLVGGKKNLKSLIMHTNPGVSNQGISVLKNMTELEFIDLSKNPQINNGCLLAFAKMKNLRRIVYGDTGITAEAVKQLTANMPDYNKPRS